MNRLMGKRLRIGKYAIPIALLLTIAVGTVAATVYVILTWTMSLTVYPNPRVHFVKWTDESPANTFTESFSIFPLVKTIQDNATYGLNSTDAGLCNMTISGITTPDNIETVYMKVFNDTETILEITWNHGESLPQSYTDFQTAKATIYTIWIEVTGRTGASGSSAVTVDMRVESPTP